MRKKAVGLGLWLCVGLAQADGILFVGNSITHHVPSPSVGWTGDWGMAASSRSSDYVHMTVRKLEGSGQARISFESLNASNFEKDPSPLNADSVWKKIDASAADRVVLFLGDNVKAEPGAWAQFVSAYESLITRARGKGKQVVCVSLWWSAETRNADLKRLCEANGGTFALLPPESQSAQARAPGHANKGVASHPGDQGMRLIADAVYTALEQGRKR
ncbi:SGNH/GDSL hydrolase family protein [Roseateles sp. DAIF2]|uniref:SGNH/GDSL hydrolase family protein n=1 Tax=Roseateles sp. DAIF2 TaxID=2714952 RepID=UPI0018A2E59C|nr:SGNH/GDSL hydrolase family protein [Roseateles sp. DAIF2]QPF75098.1 SGNH/GDSL hydrolase family protein [Roseateles sp. DAIF2]